MYLDGLSFLDDEREAWRPFEALADLPDAALAVPVADAHGWSARDLMIHLAMWQDLALRGAKELAVGEESPTLRAADAEWDAKGDAMNDEMAAAWAALPLDEVRNRFRTIPGELRGYLTVVPETRWVKHTANLRALAEETLDHYADHVADLEAILAAGR
ncbi:MAG TPA: maleylpyruvate isomerase N-terminal domain-containing protein [Candidatus Limnocylindrales bacterium]|nr:maleylpyruvate isomerase N-terminal domain-containing protein [Candidatus Limnocylindrales bacterium]